MENSSDISTHQQSRLLKGGFFFSLAAILAYSMWAFGGRLFSGEGIMYTACAIVFIGGGGLALHFATEKANSFFPLWGAFALGFAIYAIVWTALYFWLRNTHGEIFGSALGLAGLCFAVRGVFGSKQPTLIPFGVLFLASTVGYYLGDIAYRWLNAAYGALPSLGFTSPTAAKLAWGFFHGFGLGYGLTFVLDWFAYNPSSQSTTSEGS